MINVCMINKHTEVKLSMINKHTELGLVRLSPWKDNQK